MQWPVTSENFWVTMNVRRRRRMWVQWDMRRGRLSATRHFDRVETPLYRFYSPRWPRVGEWGFGVRRWSMYLDLG